MQANQENFRASEITQQNAQGYRDAVYGQLVGAFSNPGSFDSGNGLMLAAAPGFVMERGAPDRLTLTDTSEEIGRAHV